MILKMCSGKLLITALIFQIIFRVEFASGQGLIAPFQALLCINENYPEGDNNITNICNVVIINAKYGVVPASCVHRKPAWSSTSVPISPSMLYVVAGNCTCSNTNGGIKRNVISTIIHSNYNSNDLTNNIALVKLDRTLFLTNDAANQVSWIEIHQNVLQTDKCALTPQNSALNATEYPYYASYNVTGNDKSFCNVGQGNKSVSDFCLQYPVQNKYLCSAVDQLIQFSPERGTALICERKFAGMLSRIHQSLNIQHCLESGKTFATYTRMSDYIGWIYNETGITASKPSGSNAGASWSQMGNQSANGTIYPMKSGVGSSVSGCGVYLFLVIAMLLSVYLN